MPTVDLHGPHRASGPGSGNVVFLPEPGRCGGRLDPGQSLIPESLAAMVDWHVWPSASPWQAGDRARTLCHHIDYELIWLSDPTPWWRREQVGAPAPHSLWEAKAVLAEHGYRLSLEVQFESRDGALAVAVYGAGVLGRLTDNAWAHAASLLTTCASTVREPAPDIVPATVLRPARPATSAGKRNLPQPVMPEAWEVGDWPHTWWSYPLVGTLHANCPCPAHEGTAIEPFGPDGPGQPGLITKAAHETGRGGWSTKGSAIPIPNAD